MMMNYVCKSVEEVVSAIKELIRENRSGSIAYDDCTCFYAFFQSESGVTKIFYEYAFSDVDAWEHLNKLETGGYYYAGKFYNTAYGLLPCKRGHEREILPSYSVTDSNWREMLPPMALEVMEKKYPDLSRLKKAYPEWVVDAKKCFYENEDALKTKVLTNTTTPKKSEFTWVNERVSVEDLILMDAGDMTSRELVKKIMDKWEESAVRALAHVYLYQDAIEKVRKTITPEDKTFQQISQNLDELQNESANVTVHILGADSMLNAHTKHHFPDFSIEGKDIVLKMSVEEFQRSYSCGLISLYYGNSLTPVLKDGYSNRKLLYIDDFPITAIQSVSYGRKTLYKGA